MGGEQKMKLYYKNKAVYALITIATVMLFMDPVWP
jgi:hypothetical protein